LKAFGLDDNFFDLGGHSLTLARVHSRIVARFGGETSLVDLFQYPTVRMLSWRLEGKGTIAMQLSAVADRAKRQREAFGRLRERN